MFIMDNHTTIIDQQYIENQLARAAQLYRETQYAQTDELLKQTILNIQNELGRSNASTFTQNLKKGLAECFVNRAVCIFSQDQADNTEGMVEQCLQTALSLDYLNFWAYFNLASYHMRFCNYVATIQNLKCSLSCLYLLKAVLCKDLDNKAKQKDLGKAITLCNNNLEAELLRLLMNIRQNRWKNARNQIGIIEQIIGENQNLQELTELIFAFEKSSQKQENLGPFYKKAMASIIEVKRQSTPLRLNAASQTLQDDNFIKQINDRFYQFNELVNQVNELGSVFGLFQFRTVFKKVLGDKKTAIVSNLISQDNKYKIMINESVKNKQSYKLEHPAEPEVRLLQKINESKNQSKIMESLFELTKSHNDCNLSNKEDEFSGNLLSQLQNTLKPLLTVDESPQSNMSAFNLQSIFLPNMRKKECQIRVIQSEIHPLDFQELGPQEPNGNHHFMQNEQDEDLLLDSVFQIEPTPPQLNQQLVKSKRDDKVVRLFPVNEVFKYLEIFFVEMEFKPALDQQLRDIYCEIEVCGKKFRSRTVDPKKENNRVVGEWNESLGCLEMPSEPKNIKISINRYENKKFLDCTLGSGQIQMATSGINKFPIYDEGRIIGIITLKLNLHEEYLATSISSYKQSSMSSSKKSESLKLDMHEAMPTELNLLAQ